MLPVVALVGRPNVGKSTLFNYLTRTRDALVADYPGLTRDRQYGRVKRGQRDYFVVDTGGLVDTSLGIEGHTMRQVHCALEEAHLILFLVDARSGLHVEEIAIANRLRQTGRPIVLVVNKVDGIDITLATVDFHSLGLGIVCPISASHGKGMESLLEIVEGHLPPIEETDVFQAEVEESIRIAVIGRPNVGKSTLVNRLLGEDRVIVFDQPGTTRDSVFVPFERQGKHYTLIDTAGIRRRGNIGEGLEKFSVIKALQAIEKAHVVIYLIDAREGVTDQDAHLLGMVVEIGRGLVIGLNKWDGLEPYQKDQTKRYLDLKLPFVHFAEKYFLSALHGTGVGNLFDAVQEVYAASKANLPTSHLTDLLQKAVRMHEPPLVQGRRIKLKYAHQGGNYPLTIVIHGNQTGAVPGSYRRYLMNAFRENLNLLGTPIKLEFKTGDNPFKGKVNVLTERQVRKRRRLMRYVK